MPVVRHAAPYKEFWVEIGNEQGLSPVLLADVTRIAGAMLSKAKALELPFNLSFIVGGNGWRIPDVAPFAEALAPGTAVGTDHADWYGRQPRHHSVHFRVEEGEDARITLSPPATRRIAYPCMKWPCMTHPCAAQPPPPHTRRVPCSTPCQYSLDADSCCAIRGFVLDLGRQVL